MATSILDDSTQRNALCDLTMDLHSRRIALWVEDSWLRWKVPRGAMSVDLLKRLKALEPELIAHLGALQDAEGQGA